MASGFSTLDRREFLAGLGAAALVPALPRIAAAEGAQPWLLRAKPGTIALAAGPGYAGVVAQAAPDQALRFKRGDTLEVSFANDLPVPAVLDWRGLDGVPAAEPLTAPPPWRPGRRKVSLFPLRHAGTFFCDLRLLGDGAALPRAALPSWSRKMSRSEIDRDEVFLVEDWRLRADGTAIAPGIDPKDTRLSTPSTDDEVPISRPLQ